VRDGNGFASKGSPVRWPRAAPAVLFLFFLALYAGSLSRPLRGDSIWYAHDILMPGAEYFHPHHLLYNPVMRMLYLPVAPMLAGPEATLAWFRWVNILLGALVPPAFYLAAVRWGAARAWALGIGLALGLFGASFTFSSQIEMYSLTMTFLCVAMLGLALPDGSPASRILAVGGYAGAMLFHQTALFFGIVTLAAQTASWRRHGGSLLARVAVFLVLPLCLVGAVYAAVALSLGAVQPAAFWKWLTTHVQTGHWGKGDLTAATWQPALRNLYKAVLVNQPGSWNWPAVVCIALALCYAALLLDGRTAARRAPLVSLACLVWMLGFAGFNTWWDATGAEFWGMTLLPACFLLALAAPAPAQETSPRRRAPSLMVAGACLAIALGLLTLSDVALIRATPKPDEESLSAQALRRVAHDGDLVITADTGVSTHSRVYLQNPRVRVLAIDVNPARAAAKAAAESGDFTAALLDWMVTEARSAEKRKKHLWVDRKLLEGRVTTTRLLHDLDRERFVQGLKSRFTARPVPETGVPDIYELRAHPPL
jgi:hypothetical protein